MFSCFFQFSCVHCKRAIHIGRNGLCSRCQKQIKTFP
ncbi:MAG: amidophosphoribosyltransferase, partial [Haemophilus parainfluenzae]|nr:amidophosphoribosyltransferase [Haemophilus parainfluenzae]